MPQNLSDSFFGSIALKNGMLSRDQLTRALRVQWEKTREGRGPTLGEVCRMLGFLRDDEVNAIVHAQAKSEVLLEDQLLGQLCVRNRLVTRAQLQEVLEDQRALDHTVRLGDLLCEKGFIDRQQLHAVLTTQKRLKSGRLKPVIVPPEKPRDDAQTHGWAADERVAKPEALIATAEKPPKATPKAAKTAAKKTTKNEPPKTPKTPKKKTKK